MQVFLYKNQLPKRWMQLGVRLGHWEMKRLTIAYGLPEIILQLIFFLSEMAALAMTELPEYVFLEYVLATCCSEKVV